MKLTKTQANTFNAIKNEVEIVQSAGQSFVKRTCSRCCGQTGAFSHHGNINKGQCLKCNVCGLFELVELVKFLREQASRRASPD